MASLPKPSYAQSVLSTLLLILLAIVTFPLSLFVSSITFILSYRSTLASHRNKGKHHITVLVTGARTTKSLVVARIFWKAGYRVVIADEQEWGRLSASRFSRCVSKYYDLPDATKDHSKYEQKIREIIARENVKLWVPGSSAGCTINDARAGEVVRERDGVQAFIQSTREIGMLHNKDLFGDLCKDLGFTVPESRLVHSVEEAVKFVHSEDRQGRKYILKTTDLDDQGRSDMTLMPFASEAKTRAHLSKVPRGISEAHPYVLQQYISGYEFCTHCHAVDGVPQSFLSCPSSDMLMRYIDCKTSYSAEIAEAAEQWTRDFLEKWKAQLDKEGGSYHLTGHFSFDFIVEDGKLYPIECNPRIHTAIVLLSGLSPDLMAESYFGRKKNGVLSPPPTAMEHYSWVFHALPIALARAVLSDKLQARLHPYLPAGSTDAFNTSVPAVTISPPLNKSLGQVIMDYIEGNEKDPLLDWADPMPFAAQHIMWVWLLGRLVFKQGKGWSRVNISYANARFCYFVLRPIHTNLNIRSVSDMAFLLSPLRFLPLEPAQLSLATVLKCGQTFLWRKSVARATLPAGQAIEKDAHLLHEWSYGHRDRTIVLRQDANGLHYRALFPPSYANAYAEDLERDTTLAFLRKYFVLDLSLPEMYAFWAARDKNFAAKTANGTRYGGIRILRQPTWECLIEFICSSNNHISRIEGMLRRISRLYGQKLPSAALLDPQYSETEEDEIFAFPRPSDLLGEAVTSSLRAAGFGYRDAYVAKTAALVCEVAKEDGESEPEAWLERLSSKTEAEAREGLLQFAGVGPKVADCILLFGCGFGEVVPVDTHVYQIAVRDYGMKGSRDATVNKAMYAKVNEKLRAVWGDKAGWAHQILFTADLRSFSDFEDPLLLKVKSEELLVKQEDETSESVVKSEVTIKSEEVEVLPAKRKRTQKMRVETITSAPAIKSKRARRSAQANLTEAKPEEAYHGIREAAVVLVKTEQADYFADSSVFSLAERVKRGRGAKRAVKAE